MNEIERKHGVGIRISADSRDGIIASLQEIWRRFEACDREMLPDNAPDGLSISAGGSCSHIMVHKVDPDRTHDKYFEEVDTWLETQRNAQNN